MTTIDFNVTNWITITLMAMLGFLVLGFAAQAYRQYAPQG